MDIEQLAGTKLGNYEIESLLGRGGMGVVYKARQISLNRPVALKILPPTLSSDSSFVKRFQREAQAVAQIDHSNIVQIFDISKAKGLHYFSMQYVEGRTLDTVLKQKWRLDVDEAIRIIIQAAQGIEHAHKNNIIHRDVKPSNIILDSLGNVKVMDFGLARVADDRSKVTQSGTLIGTLGYMSPEQCRGEELDFRTDIYSLGVVLYEMLTGKAPFDAPNEAALIHKIVNQEPTEAKKLHPSIPDDLNAIVSRAISNNKDYRFASISEFLENVRPLETPTSFVSAIEEKFTPSIAVLPFVNMSADPDQDYFCEGISEELINALCKLKGLKVASRTSAFQFEGKGYDIKEVGMKLNVRNVLEGSVRKAGNRLRITAQLVNVDDGYHLWSERYDREMDDVFAIQDDITMAIIDSLKPRLLGGEKARLVKRQTVDLEAYNLYLKGRWFWNKRTAEGLNTAIEYFKRAIKMAPDYAAAYAGLADSYVVIPTYTSFPPKEVLPKARAAALKAVEIDDTLAEGHSSLGEVKANYWDWEGAEQEFQRAIELSPGYVPAHYWYGMFLVFRVRIDEALIQLRQAFELDPLSLQANALLGQAYLWARQYERAIEAAQRTIEMDPLLSLPHVVLGFAYYRNGMQAEAIAQFQTAMNLSKRSNPVVEAYVGVCYSLMGKRDEARQILDSLLERSKKIYFAPSVVARLLFVLGERDQAFEWLDRALEAHDYYLRFLKVEELLGFYDIASDPRFETVLKKIGMDK